MSSIDLHIIESYLFAEDKEAFLSKLVPGTESYLFLTLLHTLNTSQDLTADTEQLVEDYHSQFNNADSKQIRIRSLLKKFDTPSSDKKAILKQLQDHYLNIDLNYSKPSGITTSVLRSTQHEYPSILDPQSLSLEACLEKIYSNADEFAKLNPGAMTRVDTKRIREDLKVLEKFIFEAEPTDFEEFPDLIIYFMNKKRAKPEYMVKVFDSLSLDQLERLSKLNSEFTKDPRFAQALCKKKFKITSLDDLGNQCSKQEKRELMHQFYTWARKQKTPFTSLTSNALLCILQLDLQLNKYDKELFIEFLKTAVTQYNHMSEDHLEKFQSRQDDTTNILDTEEHTNVNQLIKIYLEEFFKDAVNTNRFSQYLDSKYLNEIFYSTKMMLGKTLKTKEVLSPEILQKLSDSVELKICPYNQEYYRSADPVKISLQIKNVPSLMIKVTSYHSFHRNLITS